MAIGLQFLGEMVNSSFWNFRMLLLTGLLVLDRTSYLLLYWLKLLNFSELRAFAASSLELNRDAVFLGLIVLLAVAV